MQREALARSGSGVGWYSSGKRSQHCVPASNPVKIQCLELSEGWYRSCPPAPRVVAQEPLALPSPATDRRTSPWIRQNFPSPHPLAQVLLGH